jgi:hypothetical protein
MWVWAKKPLWKTQPHKVHKMWLFRPFFNQAIIHMAQGYRNHWGDNTVIGTKGTKVKVLFQALHMTCVISTLVYNLKFCILNLHFNAAY